MRAEWQKKIDEVEGEMRELLGNYKTENTHSQNLQHTMDVKMSDKTQLDVEEKAVRRQLSKHLFFVRCLMAR